MRMSTRCSAVNVGARGIPRGGRRSFCSSASFFQNSYGRKKDQDTKNVQEVKTKKKQGGLAVHDIKTRYKTSK